MTPGYEYALAAMIFLGLVDLVYKRGAAAGIAAHQFLMVQAWCFTPAIVLYGLATGTLALERGMAWGMGAGLFVFVALYNFARSLKGGSVSIVAPIFRLSFTVTALLAVLVLGEPLTPYTLAGLALALAAVWLLLEGLVLDLLTPTFRFLVPIPGPVRWTVAVLLLLGLYAWSMQRSWRQPARGVR